MNFPSFRKSFTYIKKTLQCFRFATLQGLLSDFRFLDFSDPLHVTQISIIVNDVNNNVGNAVDDDQIVDCTNDHLILRSFLKNLTEE